MGRRCFFCLRQESEVEVLIGSLLATICNICVDECSRALAEHRATVVQRERVASAQQPVYAERR